MTIRPLPFLFALFAASALGQTATWSDRDPTLQMSDWEDPAHWGGLPAPNGVGAEAVIETPKISKYQVLHQNVTLGTLSSKGKEALPGGILAAEGSGAVLRFDNGDAPAVFVYQRSSRDTISLPIEFQRDLIVTNGVPSQNQWGSPNTLFFDENASFTPLCSDGKATLSFVVNSRVYPGRERNILDRKTQNVLCGFLEDSLGGAPLSLVKDGPGLLSIACCDNAYSGGTTVLGGAIYGVNAENMGSPFLPFGTHPDIHFGAGASVSFLSAKPGTWGPDDGYNLFYEDSARLSLRDASGWIDAQSAPREGRLRQVGSVSVGGTNAVFNLEDGMKLRVARPVAFAQSARLEVIRTSDHALGIADADFAAGIHASGNVSIALTKVGNGNLRLGADSDFAGGFNVVSGGVVVASARALGTGPVTFAEMSEFHIECPAFRPANKISMAPHCREIWHHPLARLGATPDEKAGCRISPGVHLGIGADLRDLQNKTIVMQGGRLFAHRDHDGSSTNAFVLGPGVSLYATTTNLIVGMWHPQYSEFNNNERLQWPFQILGRIHEHGVSATLRKDGLDRLEIGGFCDYTGGTVVNCGTMTVLPSGRLGSGPVTLEGTSKGHLDVWLKLTSPENLAPDTVVNLAPHSKLLLEFDGEITVKEFYLDGKKQAPGVWAAYKIKDANAHVDARRISGKGRLRVAQ